MRRWIDQRYRNVFLWVTDVCGGVVPAWQLLANLFTVLWNQTLRVISAGVLIRYETVISSSSDSEKSECLLERDGEEMMDPATLERSLLNSSSSSSSSSAELFLPTSLRSGCGLALVGSVCSRQPPDDSSSRSLEFLHFIRRFWNQIFTWIAEEERWRWADQESRKCVLTHKLRTRIEASKVGARSYLRVFQAEFRGQFLSVGFANVFLFLEHFLQSFALHVGEHRPPQHPSAGLPSGGQGPWKSSGDGNHRWWCCQTNRRVVVLEI